MKFLFLFFLLLSCAGCGIVGPGPADNLGVVVQDRVRVNVSFNRASDRHEQTIDGPYGSRWWSLDNARLLNFRIVAVVAGGDQTLFSGEVFVNNAYRTTFNVVPSANGTWTVVRETTPINRGW
jgi:hypothetical protein